MIVCASGKSFAEIRIYCQWTYASGIGTHHCYTICCIKWMVRWKKQYNIIPMNVAGEEGDVGKETMTSWDECACKLVREYRPKNIWKMDETGFFWKALPEKSLSKKGKQRLTWAFFCECKWW